MKEKVLIVASVASMIDQFNMSNIRLLLKLGYEVHAACNFKEGNTCDDNQIQKLQQTLDQLHVVWHPWDCPRSIQPLWKCARAYRQLSQLLQEHQFAWIHCHSPIGGALARIAAHRNRIRVVYTAHGFHFYEGAPLKNWLLYYPMEKLLSYWTDVLITVNREDYRFAKGNLRAGKVYWIPGVGVDTRQFQKPEASGHPDISDTEWNLPGSRKMDLEHRRFCETYRIPEQAVVLLSVGELNKGKNHRRIITALSRIPQTNVCYLICGQGKQYHRLQKYAKAAGVRDRIRMPGYQEHLSWIYQHADIFVFPSKREGMPVALMEAMAAGLPCVVSDVRGNRELIEDHLGGRVFSLREKEQPERYIRELLEDKARRAAYGAYNRKKIAAYDIRVVERRMKNIYKEMKNRPLISILVAVYEPNLYWLQQLLSSIRRQTYPNFEILLMDDASEHVSFQEIQKAVSGCRMHEALLWQSSCREGSNKTFEKLASLAQGRYLAFCDQDDIWERDKLEKLLYAISKEHAVMAYSDMSVMDENGRMVSHSLKNLRRGLRFLHGKDLTAYYLADNCAAGCSMLVRADVLRHAMPFSTQTYCDQWIAACVSAYGKIAFVKEPLVRYRRHTNNQTQTLGDIHSRQDYYEKRILPMYALVQEMKDRGIHYKYEREMLAFARARKQKKIADIWKYQRFSRKYACLDLLMLCMPQPLVRHLLDRLRKEHAP